MNTPDFSEKKSLLTIDTGILHTVRPFCHLSNRVTAVKESQRGTSGYFWKLAKFLQYFSNRVINRWNQLDQLAVGASSINVFKGCLSKIRETRMGFFMD